MARLRARAARPRSGPPRGVWWRRRHRSAGSKARDSRRGIASISRRRRFSSRTGEEHRWRGSARGRQGHGPGRHASPSLVEKEAQEHRLQSEGGVGRASRVLDSCPWSLSRGWPVRPGPGARPRGMACSWRVEGAPSAAARQRPTRGVMRWLWSASSRAGDDGGGGREAIELRTRGFARSHVVSPEAGDRTPGARIREVPCRFT